MAVLHVGEDVPVVGEGVAGLDECAVVVLLGVGVVVLVVAVGEVLALHLLVGDVCEVSPVRAAELLQVYAAEDVPVVLLPVGVVDNAVGVLRESFFTDEVAPFASALVLRVKPELRVFVLVFELVVVSVSVCVVQR